MRRRLVLAGLLAPTLLGRSRLAVANEPVPVPDSFVFVPGPLEAVRAAGCIEFQGYLFSKPRPAAEIMQLLAVGAPVAAASAA